jgi:uracil-DNA glycosylase
MPRLRTILALGIIAHQAVLEALGLRRGHFPFVHGGLYLLPDGTLLADSYHCSRLNTNTGKLTVAMFESVFISVARWLDQAPEGSHLSRISATEGMGRPT